MFDLDTVEANVPVPKGYFPEFIYNSVDKHWYLFAIDEKTGQTGFWFKTDGATLDNLAHQWEKVASKNTVDIEIMNGIIAFTTEAGLNISGVTFTQENGVVKGTMPDPKNPEEMIVVYELTPAELDEYKIKKDKDKKAVYFPGVWKMSAINALLI